MQIASILNIALNGMATETARAEKAAQSIANPSAQQGDPAEAMLDLITAGIGFRANAASFETGADLWTVLATIKRD